MVPARGWQVVRYKPLNELLRKTQRREVGGLHRGDVWAQDSVLHGAGRPSLVLRMSSEVGFTRERGGRGGRHEQAVPYSAAAARGGGGAYFFFSGPPRSGGLFRRCGPVASPHRPPSVVHPVARAGLARTTHPATGGSASGVASCGAPGLNAATGAFDFGRPRPAGSPSSTCRRRLCPDTGGATSLPEAPAATPRFRALGRAGQEATAAATRRNQPRPGPGAQPAAAEGRLPRGRGRASGERGPRLPRAAAAAREDCARAAWARAPRADRDAGASAGRGCMRLGGN